MELSRKTVVVTGALARHGSGRRQSVSRARRDEIERAFGSDHLALIDSDIGQFETAQGVAELAIKKFGSIEALVANAGIFLVKPSTEYTADDFRALVSTNLLGFIYITQLAVKQMQAQKSGGNVVSISAALVDNPSAGVTASFFMITKCGLNAVTRSLAREYAKDHIRFNAVTPGVVDSPLHAADSKDSLKTLASIDTSPVLKPSTENEEKEP